MCVDPSLLWMERLCILLRPLRPPLLLVKVMIPPRSPAVHLFISLHVLPSYKVYLTSISVMESGASGSCRATTRLPASPLLLQQHPPSRPPSRAQPLHSRCPFHDKMLLYLHERPAPSSSALSIYLQIPAGAYLCCAERTTWSRINSKC